MTEKTPSTPSSNNRVVFKDTLLISAGEVLLSNSTFRDPVTSREMFNFIIAMYVWHYY